MPCCLLFSLISPASAQKSKARPMTGSAARGAASGGMQVAPDLAQRLAKFRRVRMPFHSAGLTAREKKMVEKLVDASRYLEDIYWRQSDPEGLDALPIAGSKQESAKDQKLRHYLWINGSRFDLIDENRPFVGIRPMPPGRGFYPEGLTRAADRAICKRSSREESRNLQPIHASCAGTATSLRACPITMPTAPFWSRRQAICAKRPA